MIKRINIGDNTLSHKTFINIVFNVLIFLAICIIIFLCFYSGEWYAFSGNSYAPIYVGNTDKPKVALMFNVYQGSEYIPQILDTLKAYGFTATFFVGGSWAAANEDLLNRMLSEGHEIGNHGFSHKDLGRSDMEANLNEISNCNDIVLALTGFQIKLFAPPSGSYSDITLKVANSLSLKTVMWTKDTIDWRDHDSNVIYDRATKNICGGDLVLMHPTKETLKALPNICEELVRKALTARTVSEVIGE